jgi:hypothetical protein
MVLINKKYNVLSWCKSSPCLNGVCKQADNKFKCHCEPGWNGMVCDVEMVSCVDASLRKCVSLDKLCHNGTCEDIGKEHRCACKEGFTGSYCQTEVNECESLMPCQNGATCLDLVGSYLCQCPPGFQGSNCELNINDCAPNNPCQNGRSAFRIWIVIIVIRVALTETSFVQVESVTTWSTPSAVPVRMGLWASSVRSMSTIASTEPVSTAGHVLTRLAGSSVSVCRVTWDRSVKGMSTNVSQIHAVFWEWPHRPVSSSSMTIDVTACLDTQVRILKANSVEITVGKNRIAFY